MTERRSTPWTRLLQQAEASTRPPALQHAPEPTPLRTLDDVARELREVQNRLVDHDVEGARLSDAEQRLQLQLAAMLLDYGLVASIAERGRSSPSE